MDSLISNKTNNRAPDKGSNSLFYYSSQPSPGALFYFWENINMTPKSLKVLQSKSARAAYTLYFGHIPIKHDIHHKDRNRDNNSKENLEALTRSEHLKKHWEENALYSWGFRQFIENKPTNISRLESLIYQYNNNIF